MTLSVWDLGHWRREAGERRLELYALHPARYGSRLPIVKEEGVWG